MCIRDRYSSLIVRDFGGRRQYIQLTGSSVVGLDAKTGKTTLATITNVVENDSNPNYIRRNILTKGAVVESDLGRVRITSRPGHDGVINGVLL